MESAGAECDARGGSGEKGCYQFLESTWKLWSKDVAGRVLPFNIINEEYVALHIIQGWIRDGLSDKQIFWMWNSGRSDTCIEGVNRHGVEYSSCDYGQKALAMLTNITH